MGFTYWWGLFEEFGVAFLVGVALTLLIILVLVRLSERRFSDAGETTRDRKLIDDPTYDIDFDGDADITFTD